MARPKRKAQRVTLVEQLAAAIAGCGLTRYELARRSQVDEGSISRFMKGERDWNLSTVEKVANVLGLDLVRSRFDRIASSSALAPHVRPAEVSTPAQAQGPDVPVGSLS